MVYIVVSQARRKRSYPKMFPKVELHRLEAASVLERNQNRKVSSCNDDPSKYFRILRLYRRNFSGHRSKIIVNF